jgi:hypothetical protein
MQILIGASFFSSGELNFPVMVPPFLDIFSQNVDLTNGMMVY